MVIHPEFYHSMLKRQDYCLSEIRLWGRMLNNKGEPIYNFMPIPHYDTCMKFILI